MPVTGGSEPGAVSAQPRASIFSDSGGVPAGDTVSATSGTPIGQRVVHVLEHNSADVNICCVTDSVGAVNPATDQPEWVQLLGLLLAARYPLYTVKFYSWDQAALKYRAPITQQTGKGLYTLNIFGAGQPGHYLAEAEKYLDTLISAPLLADGVTRGSQPELVLIGEGHNASQVSATLTRDLKLFTMLNFCQVVARACVRAEVVPIAQNPEVNDVPRVTMTATGGTWTITVNGATTPALPFDITPAALETAIAQLSTVAEGTIKVYGGPSTSWGYYILNTIGPAFSATVTADGTGLTGGAVTVSSYTTGMFDWPPVLKRVTQVLGVGFINVYDAFRAVETFPGEMTLSPGGSNPDGTHPNAAGYRLWAAIVNSALSYNANAAPRLQLPSGYLARVNNLLTNGDFTTFTPLTNWSATNATISKDTTNFEGVKGYSLRGVPTAAGSTSSIAQAITGNALKALQGQWVTVAARVRINNADNQAGLIQLRDTNPTDTQSIVSSVSDEGQGVFRWQTVSIYVRSDCTSLSVNAYFDFGTDGGGDASFDRIVLCPGLRPQDCLPGTADVFAGAAAWYDASAITGKVDGDPLAQVNDLSGRLRHLMQGTAANQPVYKTGIINGLPVIRFDGVNDFLTAVFTMSRPYTAFIVARYTAAYATTAYLITGGGNLAGAMSRVSSTNMRLSSTSTGPEITTTPEAVHLYTCQFDSPGGSLRADTDTIVSAVNMGGTVPIGVSLGANGSSGANASQVDVGEAIFYVGTMADADKLAVQQYLKAKWATP